MKKILITYLSKLPPSENYITYESDSDKEIKEFYTNAAGIKYLAGRCGLETIIAVCSQQVTEEKYEYAGGKTSYEYFESIVKEMAENAVIKQVKSRGFGDVIGIFDAIKEIDANSEIYLDITSGFRDAAYTLALISRFLEFKGAKVERVIYSGIDGGRGKITDYTGNFGLMSLINGVSEFVNFGSCDTMYQYFYYSENEAIHSLIESMKSFSDSITLGKINSLNENLKNFSEEINRCQSSLRDTAEEKIFAELLPIIKEKFFGRNGSTDYLSVTEWCINNNLLQQAITIYIEKTPEILFTNGFLEYSGKPDDTIVKSRNKYADLFYKKFINHETRPENEFKNIALDAAEHNRKINGKYKKNPRLSRAVDRYNEIFGILSAYNTSSLKKDGLGVARDKGIKYTGKDSVTRSAWNLLMGDTFRALESMTRTQFYQILMETEGTADTADVTEDKSMERKIAFLDNFERYAAGKKDFTINTDNKKLQTISTAYVFFKAIRNEINHASDSENLNDEQKEFMKKAGFEYVMKVDYLKRILREQVDLIRSL